MSQMSNGFIKLYRKFTEWEWYDDVNTKVVFLHLLMTVNWQEKKWHGITIGVGQTWTSTASLAEQTKLTVKQVRRALDNLKSTGEITCKGQRNGTLITVENYAVYQFLENEKGKQKANKGQTEGKPRANEGQHLNKDNKENKDNNIFSDVCNRIVQHLNQKTGSSFKPTAKYIQEHIRARLNDGYTEADFIRVIDNQTAKWMGTEYEQYLTPDTLFRPSKFDKYLNAPMATVKQQQREQAEKQTALAQQMADVESRLKAMRAKYQQADIKERMSMKSDIDWLEDEYSRLKKLIG